MTRDELLSFYTHVVTGMSAQSPAIECLFPLPRKNGCSQRDVVYDAVWCVIMTCTFVLVQCALCRMSLEAPVG